MTRSTKTTKPAKAKPNTPFVVLVDAVEDGHARLVLDDEAFTVPARLLPRGAREGTWIQLSTGVVSAPASDAAALRKKLAGGDRGGPIKL
jgi:hypothetical protein